MHAFNRSLIKLRLENLAPRCRAIFALSCAERLMPLYKAFCDASRRGQWEYLRSTLDRLWDQLQSGTRAHEDEFLKDYESLVPGDNVLRLERTMLDPLAENAVLGLASACECLLSGDSEK